MVMIDDDDDDVAINDIFQQHETAYLCHLVGRVSFLHTLTVVLVRSLIDGVCFMLSFFFLFWVKSMRTVQNIKKKHS